MKNSEELFQILRRINGKGYKAYKEIGGVYDFSGLLTLFIDHVQGDPFAEPSKIRARVPQEKARLPENLFENRVRRIALQDFLARAIQSSIEKFPLKRLGSGKSGLITIDKGGQEVLERTSVLVTKEFVEARFYIGLPAEGRAILGDYAEKILSEQIPEMVASGMLWENLPQEELVRFIECVENQEHIRNKLPEMKLVAFVADDSILPRESGVCNRPMADEKAVRFKAPESFRVTMEIPNPILKNGEKITSLTGMGVPQGVSLIVGGGYHGKSTLLKALEQGVYPHIPGDGREYVVTIKNAVKIRAEDGRRVEKVDISAFINNLPYGRGTGDFSTDDASGSTSQAANILEALETGADLLLLDEDTSATNFMIRDERMKALVSRENEPITPFLERVRDLYEKLGVSTILVMGGSGEYFEVADTVMMMKNYLAYDVLGEAKNIADQYKGEKEKEVPPEFSGIVERIPEADSFDPSRGRREVKIDVRSVHSLTFGTTPVDLNGVEQVMNKEQTRAIGYAVYLGVKKFMGGEKTLKKILNDVEIFLDENGLDPLDPFNRNGCHPGSFARPRKFEIAAAINRLRTLKMRQKKNA